MDRWRRLALLVVILGLLVFANACQADVDASTVFVATSYWDGELDQVLAVRRAAVFAQIWIEYGSLLAAGIGGVVCVWPRRQVSDDRR